MGNREIGFGMHDRVQPSFYDKANFAIDVRSMILKQHPFFRVTPPLFSTLNYPTSSSDITDTNIPTESCLEDVLETCFSRVQYRRESGIDGLCIFEVTHILCRGWVEALKLLFSASHVGVSPQLDLLQPLGMLCLSIGKRLSSLD
ncbi:hypothetical protein M0802_009444 [Mischocyttarus mexicanus]|nr:hypothetical protein M0802_009444 [Mischocyttarus mexicanus]